MGRLIRKLLIALTASAVLTAAGCAPPKQTMSESRQLARERWADARSSVLYGIALQQFNAGDLDKSQKTISQALAADPERAPYLNLLARIQMERGQLERAYHTLEQAIGVEPENADSHYTMGVVFQRWQRYDAALERYEEAYRLAPDKVQHLLAAAEMMVKLEQIDAAIARLEDKLAYFENNAAIRVSVGRMYMLKRDFTSASRRLREAAVLSPDDPTIGEHCALAEVAAGHHADAIYRLQRVLTQPTYENRDDLRLVLGECHVQLRQLPEARLVFIDLTRRDPNNLDAWIKLGEVSLIAGDRVRLAESARRILALAPQRYEGHMLRGLVESQTGNLDAALASFDRAAQLAPDNTQPLILKGMTLEQAGQADGAAAAYQQALRVSPDDANARRLLAGVSTGS